MDPPIVHIEREPFFNMLIAAVDTFRRECFGYILGSNPTRNSNTFLIKNAITIQSTNKRANIEVKISKGCHQRLCRIFVKYPSIYPVIGYFHSHPEWGSIPGSHEMSDDDIIEMSNSDSELAVILKISSRKRERLEWILKPDGGVRGSYDDYVIDLNIYRLRTEEGGQRVPESLQINASAGIKDLNRANKK